MAKEKTMVSVWLNDNLFSQLTDHCKEVQQPKAGLIRQLVSDHLKKVEMEKEEKKAVKP